MRFCPVTLKTSPTPELDTLSVHISEDGFNKIRSANVGTDKQLTETIQGIYGRFGRQTAGEVTEAQVKKYLRVYGG